MNARRVLLSATLALGLTPLLRQQHTRQLHPIEGTVDGEPWFVDIYEVAPISRDGGLKLMAVVHGYFDNSGKPQDKNAEFVSLGGFVATVDDWRGFSPAWVEILRRYGLKSFHAKDFFSRSPTPNEYSHLSGDERESLLDELRLLAEQYFREGEAFGLVCTLPKSEYAAAKDWLGDKLPPLVEVCGDHCCGSLYDHLELNQCVLYYDRGEAQFYRHIKQLWDRPKIRKATPWLKVMVAPPTPLESDETPALQAADMLAWLMNRTVTACDEPYALMWGFPGLHTISTFMDRAELVERYG